jgi:hypothetical protein
MWSFWRHGRVAKAGSQARAMKRRRARIVNLEQLESRELLSVSAPNVTYHGGPLLQDVQLQSVYYGTGWSSNAGLQQQVSQVDGFLQYFADSPYMTALGQYNVSTGSFAQHDLVGQNPAGNTIADSQIRQILNAEIAANHLAAPNANSLYVFFTAPGVTVTDNGQTSVNDFAGYHDTFTDSAGATVYYAVIPYPTGGVTNAALSTSQQFTFVLSHEIAESVTDPDAQSGWFDARAGAQGEISDLANGQYGLLNNYIVEGFWSQKDGRVVVPSNSSAGTGTTSGLTVTGTHVQATAGQPFSGIVATITGADPTATATSFSATIDWGNGTTSAGTVTADPNGGFDVTGGVTYAQAGWYTVTVTVDNTSGAAVGSALTRATVAPAPPTIDLDGKLINATAGTAFNGTVATFTDVRTGAAVSDFSATIDWGDGTTTTGTVVADPNGGFDVTGTHTYAPSSTSTDTSVLFGGFGFGFGPFHGFGNQFFVLTITVHDSVAGADATALSLARVAPVPPDITAKGQNIATTSGVSFTGTVATFTDSVTTAAAGDFTATINWGDGTTSAGTVTADPNGGFDVTGTHTYTQTSFWGLPWFHIGPRNQYFLVSVSISDTKNGDTAHTESLATVAPTPPNLAVTADNVLATSGTVFTGTVATFTDVDTTLTAANFTATIDWGDGATTTGTVTADPKGGFDVTGTHTYTLDSGLTPVWNDHGPGFGIHGRSFLITVTVSSSTGDSGTAQSVASVSPVQANLQAAGTQIDTIVNTPFTGTVATFTSQTAGAAAGDFTASIDWGDGTTSTGTVTADPNGGFDVTGTHTYTSTGATDPDWGHPHPIFGGHGSESFVVTVTITHTSDNTTATAVSLASVTATAPKIATTAQSLSLTAGQAFTGTVASFTDSDGDPASHFTAIINWGDGRRSLGTIAANASGGFDVTGSHTYRFGGTYHVLITLQDTDGDSDVGLGSASVADTSTSIAPTLSVVSNVLSQSAEYYANLIASNYLTYLGRVADSAGLAFWVSQMQHGLTDAQLLSNFIGSTEYYHHAGNSSQAWVSAMYRDLLGRSPDSAGLQFWVHALASGASANAIAQGFANTPEREAVLVQSDYQKILGRAAAPTEVAGWVNAFQDGVTNEQIVAGFVSSAEFFQKNNSNVDTWLASAYQDILARNPDQAGVNYWTSVLHPYHP